MGEGFEPRGPVLGLVDFARAEAVQQRAQDAAHVRIVVDDEKAELVEVDPDHCVTIQRVRDAGWHNPQCADASGAPLTNS